MIFSQNIPQGYTYCFAGQGICPKAESCLRAIAARVQMDEAEALLKADTANAGSRCEVKPQVANAVTPMYVKQVMTNAGTCKYYRNNQPVRFAKGMTHLFEDLPMKQVHAIRLRVMRCFTSERMFYHCRKGEKLISPKEQQAIANVFKTAGFNIPPKFDSYEILLDW